MSINAATKTQNPDKHNQTNHDQPHLGLYADFLIRSIAWLIDFLILTLAKSILSCATPPSGWRGSPPAGRGHARPRSSATRATG